MGILQEISEFLQKGRVPKVKALVEQALADGIPPEQILDDGLLGGMTVIGEKFKKNEVFVPEVLIAARAMNVGVELLRPHLNAGGSVRGIAVIGTVRGDLHDIGKNIVRMMLEGKGLTVIDLGVNVPPEVFIEKAIEHCADIICCSALLTTTMSEMKAVVDKAVSAGIRERVKILIGGAPISQSFCDGIGADYYTADAASCAEIAAKICSGVI
ncbi:MAG: cobalamin-binding protein [Ruminococcaceae bacterium]|nr:cobalamin-binding protein [Oscillospiraceae bacterium]